MLCADLTGFRFGKLLVIARRGRRGRHSKWLCRCDCGNEVEKLGTNLRRGATKSCGCLVIEMLIKRNTKHGKRPRGRKTPEYCSWVAMNQRCYNPKHRHYHRYGGRGIEVCDEWQESFERFATDMGPRLANHTLGRIDNNKGYTKDNCAWMTDKEQFMNRGNSQVITIDGTTKIFSEWCREFGIKVGTASARVWRGWTYERAITTPVRIKMPAKSKSQIGKSNVRRSKAHERRVAKLLSKWSGAQFRRRRVEGRNQSVIARESTADVIAVDKIFKFSVEAKCGKGFSFEALLANPSTAAFTSWWFQASYDAELLSTYLKLKIFPMLVFKPEPNFDWVAIPILSLPEIGIQEPNHLRCLLYYYHQPIDGNISHGSNKHILTRCLENVAICRWRDFATTANPNNCFYKNNC